MDIAEIITRVEEIKRLSVDGVVTGPDYAHAAEDKLYVDFVKLIIREGCNDHAIMGKEVLKTKDIKFQRWYS